MGPAYTGQRDQPADTAGQPNWGMIQPVQGKWPNKVNVEPCFQGDTLMEVEREPATAPPPPP